MGTCTKCGEEDKAYGNSWGKNCLSSLAKKNYIKRRNNPKIWAAELKRGRDRFKIFGHKKVKSKCINCGKVWMGVMKLRKFCSQKCVSTGIHNGRWLGGRQVTIKGYVRIYSPHHPFAVRNLV